MARRSPRPFHDSVDVTALLRAWAKGDAHVEDQLFRAVGAELHRQAELAMRRESSGHTLQATALVNEAYMRLVGQRGVAWQSRAHFFGIAARMMRRVLVDYARGRRAGKRGGAMELITLDENVAPESSDDGVDILALDDAIKRLAMLNPDHARLVELRYFVGLTIEETADALDISTATVKRQWEKVRPWLRRELAPV